ncbi:hypothetical protein H4R33_001843 [Dimargaris cristalligena]|uniref:Centromere protein M n=1 Tax=Dimargaris cristalligena TaxID=215637 RepID=A0A4P9ZQ72_9FUNG|nr:hypothetical protein H4R33_001843 [Dimargaris cristalligena]RKP35616.1 hypothetical protein BJ085DRAFT_36484 [Dimargaris cristalligena]|eukprot:RKP35616.1 hypothetical protein BJ085DRAFT_36484 [Dimargaris cristalligena]
MSQEAGFGFNPSEAAGSNLPLHLLLVGKQGSGKRALAQHLIDPRSPKHDLVVHTCSDLPTPLPTNQPLHVDFVVLLVNLTDLAALGDLKRQLLLVPPEYFLGRLSILATFFDRKSQHAFELVDLEVTLDEFGELPIFYVNTQDALEARHCAQLLQRALQRASGVATPLTPSVFNTLDVNEVTVTSARPTM